jgi:hypothetical protein
VKSVSPAIRRCVPHTRSASLYPITQTVKFDNEDAIHQNAIQQDARPPSVRLTSPPHSTTRPSRHRWPDHPFNAHHRPPATSIQTVHALAAVHTHPDVHHDHPLRCEGTEARSSRHAEQAEICQIPALEDGFSIRHVCHRIHRIPS